MYERSSYVGGRSTTVNVWNDPHHPVEAGASIFVKVNRNLYSAAQSLDLPIKEAGWARPREVPDSVGIWDGDDFRFVQSQSNSFWWDLSKVIWKYGTAPIRTQRLVQQVVGKFLLMYEPPIFPFRSLSQAVSDAGLIDVTSVTGSVFLQQNGIGAPFSTDIIQASTVRVIDIPSLKASD